MIVTHLDGHLITVSLTQISLGVVCQIVVIVIPVEYGTAVLILGAVNVIDGILIILV